MAFYSNWFRKRENKVDTTELELTNTDADVGMKNPNFAPFNTISQGIDQIIASRSVINSAIEDINSWGVKPISEILINGLPTLPLLTDKVTRINQYRTIAAFDKCDWCIEEIADDLFHPDDKGNLVRLDINLDRKDLNDIKRQVLLSEFKKYMNLFGLEEDGFILGKKFVTEGELAWENIIDPEHPDRGIIGVKFIPTEYYETLVNAHTGERMGLYFDVKKLGDDLRQIISTSYYGAYRVFNTIFGYNFNQLNRDNSIPLLWPQVTYISMHEQPTPNGMVVFPLIEKAKQAYYQYVLMEQSAVILRVTHAPERLLFNVSTGRLPDKKAAEYVRRFANDMKQKKVAIDKPSADGAHAPQIANVYNPSTMLESWIFGKSQDNDGTSVESVGASGTTYDQIDDIKFFMKNLMKAFKIPWSRYEAPDQMNERNDTISYEEYDFSRLIMRIQSRFAKGFRAGYISHLKLRGIWDKYSLKESDIKVIFTPPVLFDLYERQKLLEIKIDMYAKIGDRDEFSKMTAMRDILEMTDDQIRENYENLSKEKVWMAMADWTGEQMGSNGPAKNPDLPVQVKDMNQEGGREEGGEEGAGGEEGEGGEEGGGEEAPAEEEGGGEEKKEAPNPPNGFGF